MVKIYLQRFYQFVIFLTVTSLVSGESLNFFARKCPRGDFACGKRTAQELVPFFAQGIPELDLPELDPFIYENITFEKSSYKFWSYNSVLKGLKNSVVDDFILDIDDKKELSISMHCKLASESEYKIEGKFDIIPVNGHGIFNLDIERFNINLTLSLDIKKENGKEYLVITNSRHSFNFKDGVHTTATNLVDGNPELSELALKVMNDNWEEMMNEFGEPFTTVVVEQINKCLVAFFASVSLDQLVV